MPHGAKRVRCSIKKKTVEIPQVIYTDQFIRFVAVYANMFKATNGYGRWLAEYKWMDEHGWFKPEKLRELYIDILKDTSTLSYVYWDAVHYICIHALDAAEAFASANSFDIRVITGEIAVNDDNQIMLAKAAPSPVVENTTSLESEGIIETKKYKSAEVSRMSINNQKTSEQLTAMAEQPSFSEYVVNNDEDFKISRKI